METYQRIKKFIEKKLHLDSSNDKNAFQNIDFYLHASQTNEESLLQELVSIKEGLPIDDIHSIRKLYGANQTNDEERFRALKMLASSAINPFNILLIILSILTYTISGDPIGGSIILGMVTLSIVTTFIQEYRSTKAVEKLKQMVTFDVYVSRLKAVEGPPMTEMSSLIQNPTNFLRLHRFPTGSKYQIEPLLMKKKSTTGIDDINIEIMPLTMVPEQPSSTVLLNQNPTVLNVTMPPVYESVQIKIPSKELVRGDIVHLSAGDIVPADIRLLESKFLSINQSSMTGESMAVEKDALLMAKANCDVFDCPNLVFQGTSVISGSSKGVVIALGKDTVFGQLKSSIKMPQRRTSFERGITNFVFMMIGFMLFLGIVTLLINGLTKSLGWSDAFQFSLAVAVGLTPEMLPMIITLNLARGAIVLSKKDVIVKKLNAIQNIGGMNILCTDKTGTLTDDHIIVDRSLNYNGKEHPYPLELSYFISNFQTGLRNFLDDAIINKVNEKFDDIQIKVQEITKIDEIPFDFNRRRMSIIISQGPKENKSPPMLLCKGTSEETIQKCTSVLKMEENQEVVSPSNNVHPLKEDDKKIIMEICENLNKEGFRVIAVALKMMDITQKHFEVADENEMTFVGFLTFYDPPKADTAETIKLLNERGIRIKVLTGDNALVAQYVCKKVGIDASTIMTGSMMSTLSDEEFLQKVDSISVFAKLSPQQKEQVVKALQKKGNVVGYLGDGINDSIALKVADCGISVDNAVEITKDCADIILLKKNLQVINLAVLEGRNTFGNIVKYIKMGSSSNFGNVFSMTGASFLFSFFPMTPVQILLQNFLYDLSQTGIPFDNVDEEYKQKPRNWEIGDIAKFMVFIGPINSVCDYTTWALLWWYFDNHALTNDELVQFQTTWFIENLMTQILIVHVIRTHLIPFVQSRASFIMNITLTLVMITTLSVCYGPLAPTIPFLAPPPIYYAFLVMWLFMYCVLTQFAKSLYYKVFGFK